MDEPNQSQNDTKPTLIDTTHFFEDQSTNTPQKLTTSNNLHSQQQSHQPQHQNHLNNPPNTHSTSNIYHQQLQPKQTHSQQHQHQSNHPNTQTHQNHTKQHKIEQLQIQKTQQIEQLTQEMQQANKSKIIHQAQLQRVENIHLHFTNYVKKTSKYYKSHQCVIHNISIQLQKKKKYKMVPSYVIRDFFHNIKKFQLGLHQMIEKVKDQKKQFDSIININQIMNEGVQELKLFRKEIGKRGQTFSHYISNQIITKFQKIFQQYDYKVNQGIKKIQKLQKVYFDSQKQFHKRSSKIYKICNKSKQNIEHEQDVFIQIIKFYKAQNNLRQSLKIWGLELISSIKNILNLQQKLFEQFQQILNQYKNHAKIQKDGSKNYQQFKKILNLTNEINNSYSIENMCILADLDYIKYSLNINENFLKQLNDKLLLDFFSLIYMEQINQQFNIIIKLAIIKQFKLKKQHQQLVNTVSENLVLYNFQTLECKEKFKIANLNAEITNFGIVSIDQKIKGIIFDSKHSNKFQFQDNDRAEELLIFLNKSNDNK